MALWVFDFSFKNEIMHTVFTNLLLSLLSLEFKLLGAGTQPPLSGPIPVYWETPPMRAVIETMFLLLFAGWQPRWFLLCGGILSYYDSPEDAWKGCKGSIQMAVCEIQGKKPRDLQVFFFFLSPP